MEQTLNGEWISEQEDVVIEIKFEQLDDIHQGIYQLTRREDDNIQRESGSWFASINQLHLLTFASEFDHLTIGDERQVTICHASPTEISIIDQNKQLIFKKVEHAQ